MKLVQIIWLDTNETSDSGWCSKDEAEEARPCRVVSYGVVVKENDEFITIAADTDAAKRLRTTIRYCFYIFTEIIMKIKCK